MKHLLRFRNLRIHHLPNMIESDQTNDKNFHHCIVFDILMNIFFLSVCVKRCASCHFNKHVVKMIIELTQLLSIAWHILDEESAKKHHENGLIYKKTHQNHPCAIWTRLHINNYAYVAKLGLELCKEWRYRYGHPLTRKHGSESKLIFLSKNPPPNISTLTIKMTKSNPLGFMLPMPQAMPVEYKSSKNSVPSCISAYRRYYMSKEKEHLRYWTLKVDKERQDLDKPYWWSV